MFTGIVSHIGRVVSMTEGRARLGFGNSWSSPVEGSSVCCAGVCLTATKTAKNWFEVDVSEQTMKRTTLRHWKEGTHINLERALAVGDELGGHLVFGHIDGVCRRGDATPEGASRLMTFYAKKELISCVVPRGSVALDGVALTVVSVTEDSFGVNVIPHTLQNTTLGSLARGEEVNFEADMLARYVAKRLEERL